MASFRQQLIGWFVGLALLFVATLALLLRWLLAAGAAAGARDQARSRRAHASNSATAGRANSPAVTSNLNALLDGERTRIRRYRDTLGNLAHSLKTPLAVMRQSLGTRRPRGKDGARTPRSIA